MLSSRPIAIPFFRGPPSGAGISVSLPTAAPPGSVVADATAEQPPPTSVYAYAVVDSTKSFCDLVSDGAQLILGGLDKFDLDDVELPSSFAAHRSGSSGSSGPLPTPAEVVHALSTSKIYEKAASPVRITNLADSTGPERGRAVETNKVRRNWVGPFHMAARKGQDNIVRTLLQHNADCNLRDGEGLTPLLHATIAGHGEIVRLLLSHGARIDLVDGQSRSALHWAAAERQEAVLRVLLENGGDRSLIIDKHDDSGMTPLHSAVDAGFEAGVELLLRFGASVQCSDIRRAADGAGL
ncbi:hypothetical protein EKO27_g8149 [Xylaria grammica]|uniref:Uncharacterized protein n=1 Tax=Xylaria grammica TaxID=363999 RepID=A0A439CY59_9PEZI|nr:hypothetical protein EKO27_g8149 [Xylaria grammica]